MVDIPGLLMASQGLEKEASEHLAAFHEKSVASKATLEQMLKEVNAKAEEAATIMNQIVTQTETELNEMVKACERSDRELDEAIKVVQTVAEQIVATLGAGNSKSPMPAGAPTSEMHSDVAVPVPNEAGLEDEARFLRTDCLPVADDTSSGEVVEATAKE